MDIRELRIGNSVLVNGVRAKVIDLHRDILNWKESPYRIFVEGISPETGKLMQVGAFVASDSVQPIPLTEELLKELGFEKTKSDPNFDYEKFLKDGLGIFVMKIRGNFIRVKVWDNLILKGNMLCQYLHELEQFIFLTTKKELI